MYVVDALIGIRPSTLPLCFHEQQIRTNFQRHVFVVLCQSPSSSRCVMGYNFLFTPLRRLIYHVRPSTAHSWVSVLIVSDKYLILPTCTFTSGKTGKVEKAKDRKLMMPSWLLAFWLSQSQLWQEESERRNARQRKDKQQRPKQSFLVLWDKWINFQDSQSVPYGRPQGPDSPLLRRPNCLIRRN